MPMNPRLLRPLAPSGDSDVRAYIAAVEAADGEPLEQAVKDAYRDFITGCKSDGIWDAIKASCILAGARTLAGALVPLKTADELWDGTVVPGITALGGASATYDAATLTMNSLTTGTSGASPRFAFDLGLVTGRKYTISGRLSGDLNITNATAAVRAGSTGSVTYDQSTGEFSGTVAATDQYLWIYLDSTQGPGSVTIESMSIKETTAPTNNNFVSGDYNRETGLVGNGSTKYLDSNRANNADPQDDSHNSLYISTAASTSPSVLMGSGGAADAGKNRFTWVTGDFSFDSRSLASQQDTMSATSPTGFVGHARSTGATADYRISGSTTAASQTSDAPNAVNVIVFARNGGSVPTDARLAFYSIGESLDLAALDTRVSALITAIGAAI